jgi:hypothetical protein
MSSAAMYRRSSACRMSVSAATGFPLPVEFQKHLGLGFNKTSQQLCFQF